MMRRGAARLVIDALWALERALRALAAGVYRLRLAAERGLWRGGR